MFRNYYYYFIAGLQDIFMDDTEIHFPMLDFKRELKDHLKPEDYELAELLFLPYDNEELLCYLKGDFENKNDLGRFNVQDFDIEFSDEKLGILPSYMYKFEELYRDEELSKDITKSWEAVLTEMYYEYVLETKNKFLKQWFEFNQNLKNILIGQNCRSNDIDVAKQLIGDNFVSNAILDSNAKDFGLEVDLPYVSEILALTDKENLLAREKGLDQLKWDKVEEITLFDYFTIEVVLAYTIKLDMAYRWLELDEETGRQMFGKIINDLKSGFEFPKEFAINGKINKMTKGTVAGIIANLVFIEVDGPVQQNEICYIDLEGTKLMAEVIKINGTQAYVQVFESTRGLKVNHTVEFTGHMLEVTLGPGILSKNYDGLQNDLDKMEGVFLKRGEHTNPLEDDKKWGFKPLAKAGDVLVAGGWLGEVKENWMPHKIMIPFKFEGKYTVKSVTEAGEYTIHDIIAVVTDEKGKDINLNMIQKWPVKLAIKAYKEKPRPFKLLETGVRVIDTLNPIAEGGTGFIPGPFGTGKTVLQHALSKQADADMIIVAACGERANEVVEIFTEFPELDDPRTGRKLMERTTIIANTSNMPVAAREASVYTAMTLAEYYRAMGLKVLLLADSTSRWAQALREMSNRMEELPGPDAFPMDLPAIISNFYSRAGFTYLNNGESGSITFIGTVSPAGGNLKEPVTESTKKAARCFYALSQARADSKRYPAIDALESYSKYAEYPELQEYFRKNIDPEWPEKIRLARDILIRSREVYEQINILGDDGVPVEYHERFWKGEVMDFIICQQDAFDKVDRSASMERQKYMLNRVLDIYHTDFSFESFEEVGAYFKRLINTMRQMNYSVFETEEYHEKEKELNSLIEERKTA